MKEKIPIHNFTKDDSSSIPFKLLPLEQKTQYDTSVHHRHNYYEIFFFLEGGGYHLIDFENISIKSNSIHFVSPGQVHLVKRALNSFGFIILFSRDFYYLNLENKDILFDLPFLNNNTATPVLNLTASEFLSFKELLNNLQKEYESDNFYKEELIRSFLDIILIQCKRIFENKHKLELKNSSVKELIQKFRVLLEKYFRTLHKPKDYADQLSITEKYLNEIVKSNTGKTISETIHDRLILESKRLLLHSGLSTKEVAYFLNFDDTSYFTKFFKKKVGETPSSFIEEYRKKYQH